MLEAEIAPIKMFEQTKQMGHTCVQAEGRAAKFAGEFALVVHAQFARCSYAARTRSSHFLFFFIRMADWLIFSILAFSALCPGSDSKFKAA